MSNENMAKLKNGGVGIVIGIVIAMVLGFTWGGWVTAGTLKESNDEAVLASWAAICVAQFTMAPDHKAQLAKFEKTETYERHEFVEKGGWDKMPGEENARGFVSRACADGLSVLINK